MLRRPGLEVTADAYTSLVSDETHFRALTNLTVTLDGREFRRLWWEDKVERQLM